MEEDLFDDQYADFDKEPLDHFDNYELRPAPARTIRSFDLRSEKKSWPLNDIIEEESSSLKTSEHVVETVFIKTYPREEDKQFLSTVR